MADTVETTRRGGRVLSIQSHVVHGHVGNTAAAFPLQLLGYEVNIINSVQFSNHTGYKQCKGQVLNASDLQEIVLGLRGNNLLCNYTHLLTGYVGSPSFLREVQHLAEELKQLSPHLVFVCDPVLGDNGKLYVPSELVDIYRENLLPVADIITPNQFEAELLSGIKINSEETALKAIELLLSKGPKVVVITSLELDCQDKLVLLAASKKGEKVRMVMPKLPASFTGTGDLFSASLLSWSDLELKVACEKTISTMHCVLKRTLEHAMKQSGGRTPSVEQLELRLVQSRHDIENPPDINGQLSSSNGVKTDNCK